MACPMLPWSYPTWGLPRNGDLSAQKPRNIRRNPYNDGIGNHYTSLNGDRAIFSPCFTCNGASGRPGDHLSTIYSLLYGFCRSPGSLSRCFGLFS
ncbi:hypothetical protein MPH_05436 [Macrophomina phaseolina MS6]|uniref:Uncharacterized protein n=1 Tax=Macrophomina phaseolina (strain MS6) TaxID=1126212 RepID=K2RRM8_MACPH|nr:hypothetical protein MPH_05436 [Macrophomina phaseolina MS6]